VRRAQDGPRHRTRTGSRGPLPGLSIVQGANHAPARPAEQLPLSRRRISVREVRTGRDLLVTASHRSHRSRALPSRWLGGAVGPQRSARASSVGGTVGAASRVRNVQAPAVSPVPTEEPRSDAGRMTCVALRLETGA
jgi:hypothetical protein